MDGWNCDVKDFQIVGVRGLRFKILGFGSLGSVA